MRENYTAMIVDDEAEIRLILSEFLRSTGKFKYIIEATNGSEAMNKCQNQNFDLITIDLNMPKSNGHDFVKNYRAFEKLKIRAGKMKEEAKILVFSGNITEDYLKDLLQYNIKTFLTKPVRATDFIEKVHSLLKIKV